MEDITISESDLLALRTKQRAYFLERGEEELEFITLFFNQINGSD